jgi:V/A-type H+-transporting ATPase subunit C
LLKEEQRKVYRLMKEISPEPEVFDLFLYRNDYHNVKVILKEEFSGQDADNILMEPSSISPDRLKALIRDRSMEELTAIMRSAIVECIDTFNRTGDPQVIDLLLDRACFGQMKEAAVAFKYEFVTSLIVTWIDFANIRTFLRVKSLGKSWDFLQKALLPDGGIENEIFRRSLSEPLDTFLKELKHKPYGAVCQEGIEDFKNTGSLTRFEKLSDNYVISLMRKALFKSLGIEPLIGYLVAKETEIKNARIIMVGKINNIPEAIIRERLRKTYV